MKLLRYILRTIVSIGIIIAILAFIVVLFINLSPEFGGQATEIEQEVYAKSINHKDGIFVNKQPVRSSMSFEDIKKSLTSYFTPQPKTFPSKNIESEQVDSLAIANYKGKTRLIWFGHSTFLVQIDKKLILIDPMLGEVAAPHPMLGSKRFSKELPIEIEKIPELDAVLISHDHYDHLDYGSIKKLKDKVKLFYTPLGVGVHLRKWGVPKERIIELDWWQEATLGNLKFKCAPARHFSGRGLTDRAKTLWSSWVIQSDTENIFFSGDSGYGEHFKEIGEKYGPFDFAMLECGQYSEMWPDIHMFPEETALAGLDVNAKKIMPIHWGSFKLSMHTWTDPIERVCKKAEDLGVSVVTPEIGTFIYIDQNNATANKWWQQY